MFKIPAEKFMSIILEDGNTFKHFHKIALQRFRFNTKMIEQFELQDAKTRLNQFKNFDFKSKHMKAEDLLVNKGP